MSPHACGGVQFPGWWLQNVDWCIAHLVTRAVIRFVLAFTGNMLRNGQCPKVAGWLEGSKKLFRLLLDGSSVLFGELALSLTRGLKFSTSISSLKFSLQSYLNLWANLKIKAYISIIDSTFHAWEGEKSDFWRPMQK